MSVCIWMISGNGRILKIRFNCLATATITITPRGVIKI